MGSIKKPKPLNRPPKNYVDYLTPEIIKNSDRVMTKSGKFRDPKIGYVHIPDNAWGYNHNYRTHGKKNSK